MRQPIVQRVLALLQLRGAAMGLLLGARALGDELLSDVVAVAFGLVVRPFGHLGGGAARGGPDLIRFRLGEAQHPLGPRAEARVGRRGKPGSDDADLFLDGDGVLFGHGAAALGVRERRAQRGDGRREQGEMPVNGSGLVALADGREGRRSEVDGIGKDSGGSGHSRSRSERAVVVHRPEYRRAGDRCHALVG